MKPECESKCRLLRTAMDLIWESSYGAVSVDDICRKAGVKKGSFYHFFPSKAELTVAAIEADWNAKQPELDAIFSPQTPPLTRLERFCENSLQCQQQKFAAHGKIWGCPMITLGAELSTQEEAIRAKAAEIVRRYVRYLESAIRDAQEEGFIAPGNAREAAERVFSLFHGSLLQAKILNELNPLRDLNANILRLLEVRSEVAVG
jgi:TetR/AcrR family transcriptional repressor of nem operon